MIAGIVDTMRCPSILISFFPMSEVPLSVTIAAFVPLLSVSIIVAIINKLICLML